jgi:hypothetical protein
MCDPSPENRTSARELYQWLSQFEEEINNFEDFECSELPEKLRAEIERSGEKRESQVHEPQPPVYSQPVSSYQGDYKPASNTYVSTHFSYKPPSSTNGPPPQYMSYIPPGSTTLPAVSRGPAGASFSYKTSGPADPVGYGPSRPIVIPSSSAVGGDSSSVGVSGSGESTYVPYSSKFSLNRIDEQL